MCSWVCPGLHCCPAPVSHHQEMEASLQSQVCLSISSRHATSQSQCWWNHHRPLTKAPVPAAYSSRPHTETTILRMCELTRPPRPPLRHRSNSDHHQPLWRHGDWFRLRCRLFVTLLNSDSSKERTTQQARVGASEGTSHR
jgi:hypothetical protein